MSNWPMPGEPIERQSWMNDAHDLASVGGHICATAGLLALAARLRIEPSLQDMALPAAGAAIASSGVMSYFARDVVRPGDGIVQRIGITIPLASRRASRRLLRRVGLVAATVIGRVIVGHDGSCGRCRRRSPRTVQIESGDLVSRRSRTRASAPLSSSPEVEQEGFDATVRRRT
jgi:hypothetical protein